MTLYAEAMKRKGDEGLLFLLLSPFFSSPFFSFYFFSFSVLFSILKEEKGDRLFSLAMSKFEAALGSTLDNHVTLKSWADALFDQSQRKKGEERSRSPSFSISSHFLIFPSLFSFLFSFLFSTTENLRLIMASIEKYSSIRQFSSLQHIALLLHKMALVRNST